jgi:hypothetical protein
MCISKTIYKYFANKELLIEESVQVIHNEINNIIDTITSQDFNAIEENFEIRRMFENMFKSTDTSPVYQLKKHYPRYQKRSETVEIKPKVLFITSSFITPIFSINENIRSERSFLRLKWKHYNTILEPWQQTKAY